MVVNISRDFVPFFGSNSLSWSRKSAGCVSSTMFGQKIFINNLILIGSNPVIVLLLYMSSPSCWSSRHHQHFFSCGLKHLLLASRLPCIQRLQLKWLMSQLAASLPLPTNYLTPWTFSLRSLELLLLLPLLPPLVPALVGNSWMFAPKMKSCSPNGHSWSHLVWQRTEALYSEELYTAVECNR